MFLEILVKIVTFCKNIAPLLEQAIDDNKAPLMFT